MHVNLTLSVELLLLLLLLLLQGQNFGNGGVVSKNYWDATNEASRSFF